MLTLSVFQPFNVLGLLIYGTELLLWLGVFACGGYYNWAPWMRERKRIRRDRAGEEHEVESERSQHTSGAVALHRMPSSTSVFRTPSSDPGVEHRVGDDME